MDPTRSRIDPGHASTTAAVARNVATSADRQGTTDGRYVLQRELARGGMGRIWIADDTRLSRRVAIKELLEPSGAHGTRFELELSLTSRLEHPSIVSIHDGGTWADGKPFYVMKLVSGESLDVVIAHASGLAERLALLPHGLAVVDALAYAHAQGIVHRDLKPANILVGDFGETVVIDWGLAKDLRAGTPDLAEGPYRDLVRGGATIGGEVMGTPAYMPPEQAMGDAVDERADVYALGGVLYHLLSGARPHKGTTVDEILASVISAPPPPLATRAPGVPADLVTIVEKAMARRPEDRYATAGELAVDLKRFQQGQLVGAHRYSGRQLLWRWLRKHRTAVAVASVAIVLLGVIGAVSLRRIVREQARTDEQRKVAEQSRGEAQDLMSFMLVDLRDKLQPLGRLDLLDAAAKKAVEYYGRRGDDVSDAELVKRSLARRNLGDVLSAQGHADGALTEYRAALAISETLAAKDVTSADRQRDLTAGHMKIGDVVAAQGHTDGALEQYQAALAIAEKLVVQDPTNIDQQRDVSACREKVGDVVFARGDTKRALAEYRASLAITKALAARAPANTGRQRDVSVGHEKVAMVVFAQGDAAGARAELEAAMAIREMLVAKDPTNADWQRELSNGREKLGNVLRAQGDVRGALAQYRASLAIDGKLAANDPTNADRQRDLAVSHQKVGIVLRSLKDVVGALVEYRASLAIFETLAAKDPTNADRQNDLSAGHSHVGDVLLMQQDATGALAEFRASLAICEALAAKDPTNTDWQRSLSISHDKLGYGLLAAKDQAGALVEFRAALAISETLAAKDPTNADWQADLPYGHDDVGDVLQAQGDTAGALSEYRASLAVRTILVAKDATNAEWQSELGGSHERIGDVVLAQGDRVAALAEYRAASAVMEKLVAQEPTNPRWKQGLAETSKKLAGLRRQTSSAAPPRPHAGN